MAGQRNRKGTVAVQSFKGVLRLVWSYQGKQHYLYCGLADTPLNRIVAEGKSKVIQGDLATGNFDPSLAKYKPEPANQISVVALFQRFMESRQKLIYSRANYGVGGDMPTARYAIAISQLSATCLLTCCFDYSG